MKNPDSEEKVKKFLVNTTQMNSPFHGLGRLSSIMTTDESIQEKTKGKRLGALLNDTRYR